MNSNSTQEGKAASPILTVAEAYGAFHRQTPAGAAWLGAKRDQAVRVFEANGLPDTRSEDWKYTSLREFAARSAKYLSEGSHPVAAAIISKQLEKLDLPAGEPVAVFANGLFNQNASSIDMKTGAAIHAFQQLDADVQASVFDQLGAFATVERYPMAALNTAFLADGLLVDVPAGTEVKQSMHVVFLTDGQPVSTQPRLLVRAGANSSATLIEYHIGTGAGLCNAIAEIHCGSGSTFNYTKLQNTSNEAFHLAAQHAVLEKDSCFNAVHIDTGGQLARNDLNVRLTGSGAHAALFGLFLASDQQHVDNHTLLDHQAEATTSEEIYRGLVSGGGTAVFNGRIVVHPGADKTDAQLSNHNLLLSPSAEVNTKPELEIYADDVKCSHGSTTGQLDENSLHYLQTRGIPADEARRMLVGAFTDEITQRIKNNQLQGLIENLVTSSMEAMQ